MATTKKPGKKYIVNGKTYRAVPDYQLVGHRNNSELRRGMAIFRCSRSGDKEVKFFHKQGGRGWCTGTDSCEWGFVTLKDAIGSLERRG